MINSNGIIVQPVGIADVQAALKSNCGDLGKLCQHASINKWSRRKPYNYPGLQTMSDRMAQDSGYGLEVPVQSLAVPMGAKSEEECISFTQWLYAKPTGTKLSPFRLQDWNAYTNDSVPVVSHNMAEHMTATTHLVISFSLNKASNNNIRIEDMKIANVGKMGDLYLGLAIFHDYDTSGNSGLAYIVTSATSLNNETDGNIAFNVSALTEDFYKVFAIASPIAYPQGYVPGSVPAHSVAFIENGYTGMFKQGSDYYLGELLWAKLKKNTITYDTEYYRATYNNSGLVQCDDDWDFPGLQNYYVSMLRGGRVSLSAVDSVIKDVCWNGGGDERRHFHFVPRADNYGWACYNPGVPDNPQDFFFILLRYEGQVDGDDITIVMKYEFVNREIMSDDSILDTWRRWICIRDGETEVEVLSLDPDDGFVVYYDGETVMDIFGTWTPVAELYVAQSCTAEGNRMRARELVVGVRMEDENGFRSITTADQLCLMDIDYEAQKYGQFTIGGAGIDGDTMLPPGDMHVYLTVNQPNA